MYNSFIDDASRSSIRTNTLYAPLSLGITTRVLALKIQKRQESIASENASYSLDIQSQASNRRRSSRFLEGTFIPNSIIQVEEEENQPDIKDKATKKKERDIFVANVLEKFKQKEKENSIIEEKIDREALMKIKEELQRRSLVSSIQEQMTKKSLTATIESLKTTKNEDVSQWEKLKEKRRISHRTAVLLPLNGVKHPTIESIRQSIENSKEIQKLLNVDIEQRKDKLIQTEVAIIPDDVSSQETNSINIKVFKKGKVLKRKSSVKKDRSINGSIGSKSITIGRKRSNWKKK